MLGPPARRDCERDHSLRRKLAGTPTHPRRLSLLVNVSRSAQSMIDDLWYKNAVIYCLSVATYMDSNGDGVGDFRGLLNRLDYLQGLGVTAIWLMPFQPSPLKD